MPSLGVIPTDRLPPARTTEESINWEEWHRINYHSVGSNTLLINDPLPPPFSAIRPPDELYHRRNELMNEVDRRMLNVTEWINANIPSQSAVVPQASLEELRRSVHVMGLTIRSLGTAVSGFVEVRFDFGRALQELTTFRERISVTVSDIECIASSIVTQCWHADQRALNHAFRLGQVEREVENLPMLITEEVSRQIAGVRAMFRQELNAVTNRWRFVLENILYAALEDEDVSERERSAAIEQVRTLSTVLAEGVHVWRESTVAASVDHENILRLLSLTEDLKERLSSVEKRVEKQAIRYPPVINLDDEDPWAGVSLAGPSRPPRRARSLSPLRAFPLPDVANIEPDAPPPESRHHSRRPTPTASPKFRQRGPNAPPTSPSVARDLAIAQLNDRLRKIEKVVVTGGKSPQQSSLMAPDDQLTRMTARIHELEESLRASGEEVGALREQVARTDERFNQLALEMQSLRLASPANSPAVTHAGLATPPTGTLPVPNLPEQENDEAIDDVPPTSPARSPRQDTDEEIHEDGE